MKFKNCLLTFGLMVVFVGNSFAQNADSLAQLYQNYMKLWETHQTMTNKVELLDKSIQEVDKKWGKVTELDGKVSHLNSTLNTNLENVNRLTQNDLFTKKSRLNAQKQKIVNTATFVGYAVNSFDAIDAAFAQSDYMTDISSLNNPNNEELGFSLSDEITKLLNKEIIKGDKKFNGKNAKKFLDVAKNIIEDPFVATFTSAVPGLSAIQGVLGLVSNIIVKEEDVTVEDYKAFKKEMDKFINHYNGLAKAEGNFTANLNNLDMRLEALRTVVNNYTMERVRAIHPEGAFGGIELSEVIATNYTPLKLERNIDDIMKEYNENGMMNYTAALEDERLYYPIYAINQAQFIKQELEALNNEYISSYRNFHKAIKKVLLESKALSKDNGAAVDKKIMALDSKLERLIATFEKNVKIGNVVNALNNIPTY
jgi:hypothetical protein